MWRKAVGWGWLTSWQGAGSPENNAKYITLIAVILKYGQHFDSAENHLQNRMSGKGALKGTVLIMSTKAQLFMQVIVNTDPLADYIILKLKKVHHGHRPQS